MEALPSRPCRLACAVAVVLGVAGCASGPDAGDGSFGSSSSALTSACPTGPFPQGVDTSTGQGTVNWHEASDAGIAFAIMKATQSDDYTDSTFATNWANARDAGVARAAYHFFDPTVDGTMQAEYFLKAMGPLDAEDLSPMLDIECPDGDPECLGYAGGTGDATAADIAARMHDWLTTVEAATGRKPLVYSFADYFAENQIATTGLEAYPLWIAGYTGTGCFEVPSPWPGATIWQYGDDGTVAGISAAVDTDWMIGPIDELRGWPAPKRSTGADVNGDGVADVCGRASSGVTCALARSGGFATPFDGPPWSDTPPADAGTGDGDAGDGGTSPGWRAPAYSSTVQFADVNGDGKADVCGRSASGVTCALSTGDGFAAPFAGPGWSDATGFLAPATYATLQFADVNGDGKADACVRAAAGITCAASTGAGFSNPFSGPAWSDSSGWDALDRYRTIRFPDIDRDGLADVCGRSSDGLHCALSTGDGFGADIAGPGWSDATGWSAAAYASTIQFPDIDGDGRADVCARSAAGLVCAPSTGHGFGALFDGPAWSDAMGWSAPAYYATLVFLDIDGDGRADVCARGPGGVECALSLGTSFATSFAGPAWSDAAGWSEARYYGTLGGGDVNGDGKDDLCARGPSGVLCAPSTGAGFGAEIDGPAWSDAAWGLAPYWASVSVIGHAHRPGVDGGVGGDAGAPPPMEDAGNGVVVTASVDASGRAGCSCDVAPGACDRRTPLVRYLMAVAAAAIAGRKRRRVRRLSAAVAAVAAALPRRAVSALPGRDRPTESRGNRE